MSAALSELYAANDTAEDEACDSLDRLDA